MCHTKLCFINGTFVVLSSHLRVSEKANYLMAFTTTMTVLRNPP